MSSYLFKKVVAQKFWGARLTLRKEALGELNEYLRTRGDRAEILKLLDELVAKIKEIGPSSNIIDSAIVRNAIKCMDSSVAINFDSTQIIFVIDAARTTKFTYDVVRKTFHRTPSLSSLHGDARSKRDMLVHRFHTIHQRLLRQKQFAPPENRFEAKRQYIELTLTRSLLTQPGEKRVIFGLLSCMEEGKYCIEDLDSNVEIDLSEAKIDTGLFTENCFVLAEGVLDDEIFKVSGMSFPPAETRKQSLLMYPSMKYFGQQLKSSDRIRLEEMNNGELDNHMIIIISEIWLDKPEIMEYLRITLQGFSDQCPPLFVFMGNFTSKPMGLKGGDLNKVEEYFNNLADLICEFPNLVENSKFVFIPGPNDIGIGSVLPRPGLPEAVTRKLRSNRFPQYSVMFPSNPCRILYGTRELLLFRQDITHQMRRNCVLPPATHETKDITNHLVKTVLEQSHLCPLPLPTRPVHWNREHSLHIYPLPDLLVLADSVEHFNWSHYECTCVNPASFALDQSFIVYFPGQNRVQFSRVDRSALDGQGLEEEQTDAKASDDMETE